MKTTIKQDQDGNVISVSIGDYVDDCFNLRMNFAGTYIALRNDNDSILLSESEARIIHEHLGDMIWRMKDED